MKKILLAFMVLGSFGAFAEQKAFTPLIEYMQTTDPNDAFTWEFIAKRCSAIHLTLASRWWPDDSENKKISESDYKFYANAAINARSIKQPNADETELMTTIINDISALVDPMDSVMKDNQNKSGSVYIGSWINDDMMACKKLFKS
jgi:hypothetical protein